MLHPWDRISLVFHSFYFIHTHSLSIPASFNPISAFGEFKGKRKRKGGELRGRERGVDDERNMKEGNKRYPREGFLIIIFLMFSSVDVGARDQ